ncbi:MAG TPA: energy transducer TonB, partial [Steroidobacteraceae bacterium]|nr:energy transducer TonB [Steroidobacteraceae bacterium]
LSDVARPDVTIAEYDLVCAARPPIDKSQLTPKCKKTLDTRSIDLNSLYPAASRRESEEGPVVLQFTLTHEAAPPGDIKVVGSSLFPRLDAAAVVALSKAMGSTECERGTYLFEVNFELRD